MPATVNRISIGLLRKDSAGKFASYFVGVAELSKLPAESLVYVQQRVDELVTRSDAYGQAQVGRWDAGNPPTELAELLGGKDSHFKSGTESALKRLAEKAPGTAAEGLILFARVALDTQIDERLSAPVKCVRFLCSYQRSRHCQPRRHMPWADFITACV